MLPQAGGNSVRSSQAPERERSSSVWQTEPTDNGTTPMTPIARIAWFDHCFRLCHPFKRVHRNTMMHRLLIALIFTHLTGCAVRYGPRIPGFQPGYEQERL